jgi:hypothetical protein
MANAATPKKIATMATANSISIKVNPPSDDLGE